MKTDQTNMAAMLNTLTQLPRTLVLLLQPQDFSKYSGVSDRDFLCDNILTSRCGSIVIIHFDQCLKLSLLV